MWPTYILELVIIGLSYVYGGVVGERREVFVYVCDTSVITFFRFELII